MMSTLIERLLQYRLVRFALTGGIATAIHVGVAFMYLHLMQDNVFVANVFGFSLAFVFSYFSQTLLVFKNRVNFGNALRFFIVQFGALLVAQGISELFSDLNSYLRVIMVVFILPIVTYIIHKVWTFSDNQPSQHTK
ncbi:GtrA family protein [Vibrio mediterranei]|nr:GtrA family protein [Vibrio mediterranei]